MPDLRIATWNCAGALHRKWEHLDALGADLMIVQECGDDSVDLAREHGWSAVWAPAKTKGLGLFARPGWELEELEHDGPWWLPACVSGPVELTLVGMWALPPSLANGMSYVAQGQQVAERLDNVPGPIVVGGDFNATNQPRHLAMMSALESKGMTSAYHLVRGCERGEEPEATYFHQWKQDRPFHIDLLFTPAEWDVQNVECGGFEEFTASNVSDHVPVVATVNVPDVM